jgi:hypothetical protein
LFFSKKTSQSIREQHLANSFSSESKEDSGSRGHVEYDNSFTNTPETSSEGKFEEENESIMI